MPRSALPMTVPVWAYPSGKTAGRTGDAHVDVMLTLDPTRRGRAYKCNVVVLRRLVSDHSEVLSFRPVSLPRAYLIGIPRAVDLSGLAGNFAVYKPDSGLLHLPLFPLLSLPICQRLSFSVLPVILIASPTTTDRSSDLPLGGIGQPLSLLLKANTLVTEVPQ